MTKEIPEIRSCDILVIGAGAGGLASAVTARLKGLDVIVAEKEPVVGGSMARSGGWLWIPCSSHAKNAGISDSREEARRYLEAELGNLYDQDRIDQYLATAPEMLDFFERNTEIKFILGTKFPDYHEHPGAKDGGRAVCAAPIDGRVLGKSVHRMGRTLRAMRVLGIAVHTGPDIVHFMAARRSLRSALYVAKRFAKSVRDRTIFGRDMQMGNGAALTARCLLSAERLGIPILTSSPVKALLHKETAVIGAEIMTEGGSATIMARKGVILATGGFSNDIIRRAELFPHAALPGQHLSVVPAGNVGDGIALGLEAGGNLRADVSNPAAWFPVSLVKYRDGSTAPYLHAFDRAKPGVIAVRADGRRFVDESCSYHDFVPAMLRGRAPGSFACAYLVADSTARSKYGLGFSKPAPLPIQFLVDSGYLLKGDNLSELAQRAGIDPDALNATVEEFNIHARRGIDPIFGRGSTKYNRSLGDPENQPNPCLGALGTPPFFAVKMIPGDIGTLVGLKTDSNSRVLDRTGHPIQGLYAVGNDSSHIFGGTYPGGGSMLGPAFTFGYLAACHAASAADLS